MLVILKAIRPHLFTTRQPFRATIRIPRQTSYPVRQIHQMATVESLNQEIAERSALFNDARKEGTDAAIIEEHRLKLGELKRALGQLMGASGSKDTKKKDRLLLKTAKVRPQSSHNMVQLQLTRLRAFRAQGTLALVRCTAANTLNGS